MEILIFLGSIPFYGGNNPYPVLLFSRLISYKFIIPSWFLISTTEYYPEILTSLLLRAHYGEPYKRMKALISPGLSLIFFPKGCPDLYSPINFGSP